MVSCSKLLYFKFYIIEIKDNSNLFEVDFEDVGVDVKKNYDCENLVLKRMFKVGDQLRLEGSVLMCDLYSMYLISYGKIRVYGEVKMMLFIFFIIKDKREWLLDVLFLRKLMCKVEKLFVCENIFIELLIKDLFDELRFL